jgi:hypothetical protein
MNWKGCGRKHCGLVFDTFHPRILFEKTEENHTKPQVSFWDVILTQTFQMQNRNYGHSVGTFMTLYFLSFYKDGT